MSSENEENKGGEGKPTPPPLKLIQEGKDPTINVRRERQTFSRQDKSEKKPDSKKGKKD